MAATRLSSHVTPTLRVEPSSVGPGASVNQSEKIPSPYNAFLVEEIRRVKEENPGIENKMAVSKAARNWKSSPMNPNNEMP